MVLPVDSAGTSIRFNVHLIKVDINLWDFHLKAVGKELDGFPDSAIARSPWQRKKGLGSSYSNTRKNMNTINAEIKNKISTNKAVLNHIYYVKPII